MQTSISAVVLTKNSEKTLSRCLDSLRWCKEIIIIDDYSSDTTLETAKKYNPKIFVRPLQGDFSEQRNFGLSKATNDWVFFVDSDEVVPNELAEEIHQQIEQFYPHVSAFSLKRHDYMWGKKLQFGDTGRIRLVRLFRKEKGTWVGKVHERVQVIGEIGMLKQSLYHYPHATITEFLSDINFYSTLRAEELKEKNVRSRFFDILFLPLAKLLVLLVLKQGIRDGIHGIVHALLMSFYTFLVRGKLYLMQGKSQKLPQYWSA